MTADSKKVLITLIELNIEELKNRMESAGNQEIILKAVQCSFVERLETAKKELLDEK